jgi:hypothetical protein
MKLSSKTLIPIGLLLCLSLFSIDSNAQCKRFTKRNCVPSLAPFVHNGQLTSAIFNPGETADIEMTFNAGKEYRIIVCGQEMLGNVQFKVLDKSRKVIYKSGEDETNPSWDFKVASTQQLIIQIVVPKVDQKNQLTQLTPQGCVSILIGFKE